MGDAVGSKALPSTIKIQFMAQSTHPYSALIRSNDVMQAAGNYPGALYSAVMWLDANNDICMPHCLFCGHHLNTGLFGGYGKSGWNAGELDNVRLLCLCF